MKILTYVGIVILTIYLGIMYPWKEGVWLLSAELVFPLLCMGMAWFSARNMRVNIEPGKDTAERGEELLIRFSVRNQGKAPALVKLLIFCHYLSEKETKTRKEKMDIASGTKAERQIHIRAEYCGKLLVTVQKLYVYDCWGIFSVRKKQTESYEIMVMPKPYPVNLLISNRTKWFPIDGESYARDRSGDDTAEIYEVREYRAGDRMQKVHWKLSAKEEELYIKEFSYPLGASVVLLLERGDDKEQMEQFMEMVVSISTELLRLDCPHYVAWQKKEERQISRMLIAGEEDFHAFLLELLRLESECLEKNMEEYYRYAYKSDTYSTLFKIGTDLTFQINREEPMRVDKEDPTTFFGTVEIVV